MCSSLAWPDPLFGRHLSIDNYKRVAARGYGIVRIVKCSDTLSFFRVIMKHLVNFHHAMSYCGLVAAVNRERNLLTTSNMTWCYCYCYYLLCQLGTGGCTRKAEPVRGVYP